MTCIMIVEDDELYREFLREAVELCDLSVDEMIEAANGKEALSILERRDVDMLVLDLQLPEKPGVDIARAAWAKNDKIPILFWSNYAEEAFIRGIRRVAPPAANYGYLLKTSSKERLVRALSGVLLDHQMIIDRAVSHNRLSRKKSYFEDLTTAEYEVLLDIAIGLTDGAIARYRCLSTRTVQSRLQSLYAKLGLNTSIEKSGKGESINRRCRAVALALYSRILNAKTIEMAERELAEHHTIFSSEEDGL